MILFWGETLVAPLHSILSVAIFPAIVATQTHIDDFNRVGNLYHEQIRVEYLNYSLFTIKKFMT